MHLVCPHPVRPSNRELTAFSVHFTPGGIGGTFVRIDAGGKDDEQKGQGRVEEGALAVHVFHDGVEGQIQEAGP